MNKKQTIRLNESQLRHIVSESVKRVLKEYEDRPEEIGKQEDDNYYGGGLPESEPKYKPSSCEKEITEIYNKMKPYIDRLADIFNNTECDDSTVYNKIMNVLEELDKLPLIGKHFSYSYD